AILARMARGQAGSAGTSAEEEKRPMAKFPRFLTLPIAAVMLVAACGGGGTPAPSTGGGASAPAASVPAASTGAGGSAVAGGTITVTSLWGGSEEAAFQKVLDAFKAKTGITATYSDQRPHHPRVLQDQDQHERPSQRATAQARGRRRPDPRGLDRPQGGARHPQEQGHRRPARARRKGQLDVDRLVRGGLPPPERCRRLQEAVQPRW